MNVQERSFVSGVQKDRIKVEYYFNQETGHFYAKVFFGNLTEGPPGHVHGGAISAVLDEAMGGAAWQNGYPAMTVRLTVSFRKPVKLGSELLVETWVNKAERRRIMVKGKMMDENNTIIAEAEGIFIKQSKERFQKMGNITDEFFVKVK